MKNKVFIFTIGLFAGLTIGVLFSVAIKALVSQVRLLHVSLNKIDVKESELSQRLDSIQGKLIPDIKKTGTSQQNVKIQTPLTSQNNTQQGAIKAQSRNNSMSLVSKSSDSDIVVMTNQLIVVTSVKVTNRDTAGVNKKTKQTDSTIAALSDVSESQDPKEYRVEFWKSPLNYKGYKMSRGKIVIYGLNPAGGEMFIAKDGGSYYLVNGATPYRLEYTDDYKPLEQLTDKAMLKKLRL